LTLFPEDAYLEVAALTPQSLFYIKPELLNHRCLVVTEHKGQEEADYPFEIVNYISLLAEAMGIEHPDLYKKYKLAGDPEAVFEEVREYVDAHRLDPAKVLEVLRTAFAPACESRRPKPS